MPKVSVNILTKNRAELLKKALESVDRQTFRDFELIAVDDASTDETSDVLRGRTPLLIKQPAPKGITFNRQAALEKSTGDYIAILDDDDEWLDTNKLKKQVEFLDNHSDYVLIGGGISANGKLIHRPQNDAQIRSVMLLRNNFFTSTVMFRREAAIKAGGFMSDGMDLAEDYDLWLRMGKLGKMYNFNEAFTLYSKPNYNTGKFKSFLVKQVKLIKRERSFYPGYFFAYLILKLRTYFKNNFVAKLWNFRQIGSNKF
jgi:glycosyltransferase involved in cell wall biosynthesis